MDSASIARSLRRVRQALARRPAIAVQPDVPAKAELVRGLCTRVALPGGGELITDLGEALGGGGGGVPPGWLMRAGLASCLASAIALRAAELGIELRRVEVVAGGESDARGLFEHHPPVAPGPLHVDLSVTVEACGAQEQAVRDLVAWADAHSPVSDALRRNIDLRVQVQPGAA